MKYGTLIRRQSDDKQTLGHLTLFESNNVDVLMTCYMLELDDDGNKVRQSRIPAGVYKVIKRNSPKYGDHYHILDVKNRTLILIHLGNYHTDILGCLLAGRDLTDINGDGYRDVTSSKLTMKKLLSLAGGKWQLEIIDRDKYK